MHGIRGNQNSQPARADRDFVFRENLAQFFHGAAHTFLRGIVAHAENGGDFGGGFLMKIAQDHGIAVSVNQFAQRGIQVRFDLLPPDIR